MNLVFNFYLKNTCRSQEASFDMNQASVKDLKRTCVQELLICIKLERDAE